MHNIRFVVLTLITMAFVGCATKTITSGREFDVARIGEIKKGVTTSDELIGLLGQPFTKSVQPDGTLVWNYSWKKGTATTTQSSEGPVVTSTGDRQTLEVQFQNGVVENYTYQDDPFWNAQLKGSQ